MHSVQVFRVHHGSAATCLGRLRGRRAAIWCGDLAGRIHALLTPLVAYQPLARRVAPGDHARIRPDGPQVRRRVDGREVFLSWAPVECELPAIEDEVALLPPGAGACAMDLQLEGEGPTVDQAHVHVIAALGGCIRARLVRATEGALELRIHRRRAVRIVVLFNLRRAPHTSLAGAPASAERAVVALGVATHLRPIARGGEAVGSGEIAGFSRINPDVLPVRASIACSDVRDPDWLPVAPVSDVEALAVRRRPAGERGQKRRQRQQAVHC
mmetsp:Transcript_107664/g.309922  ORF Transcript_107664/g.309922 Transcript_107664/m.309922 type:complete len:270 (-) Transcript_107664:60-869(-)